MRIIQILLISTMMSGLFACKCHKDASKETASTTSAQSTSATQNSSAATTTLNSSNTSQTTTTSPANKMQEDSVPSVYRVAVSFISFGAGTDPDGRTMLDK